MRKERFEQLAGIATFYGLTVKKYYDFRTVKKTGKLKRIGRYEIREYGSFASRNPVFTGRNAFEMEAYLLGLGKESHKHLKK